MSFMKKVAQVAAPFASLIPGVGPLVGAGLGVLGSIGGGGGGKKGKIDPMQQQYMNLLSQGEKRAGETFNLGKPMVDAGNGLMDKSADFYGNILAGGDKSSLALQAPIFDITKGYEQAQKNTLAMGPRGSAASAFADNAQSKARDIAKLRSSLLMDSASGLAGIGASRLGAGSNLISGGNAATGNVLSAMLGSQSLQVQKDQIAAQKWGGLGQGIGSLLGTLLMPGGILNKGGGGGGQKTSGSTGSGGGGIHEILHLFGG